MKTWLLGLTASLFFGACAAQNSTIRTQRPLVASMQPMAPDPTSVEVPEDNSASAHLERAFISYRRADYRRASRSFSQAIGTNNLNDSGRALAYWHIYLCQAELGSEDRSAGALMSFVTVAEDMLSPDDRYSHEALASQSFVERFDLEGRLARARAVLSAIWVSRSQDYGRSDEQPVRIQSEHELDVFLELVPPCSDANERQVDRKILATDGELAIEEITLFCNQDLDGARFVIEHVED